MFNISEELNKLPVEPGVYLMEDKSGNIIYVGKAKNLKNRVRQYFQSSRSQHPKVRAMVKNIYKFDYIIVDTEIEALILESNLIKKHRPKYNILLRDDKQYPFLKITYRERFPRVLKTRKVARDGAKYFGPYPSVFAVNNVVDFIHDFFPIRNCNQRLNKEGLIDRPCLNYHIKKCLGPCKGFKYEKEYMEEIKKIDRFLSGRDKEIIKTLEEKMKKASADLDFETAAIYRDYISSIEVILEKQKIITDISKEEDIIAMARGIDEVCVQVFFLRSGKIIGREHFIIEDNYRTDKSEILSSFLKQFYSGTAYIPKEIIIESEIKDQDLIESWFSKKKGSNVGITVPKRGEKLDLISMVKNNALNMLKRRSEALLKKTDTSKQGLEELREILDLKDFPKRIEAFDVSNIQGVDSVASMVVFENGQSKKSDYRRFKIRTVEGPDDYASLQEVLIRRFKRGLEEKEYLKDSSLDLSSFSIFPDLLLMDGGKGQVNIAQVVLDSLGLEIPVAGLVKDDFHQTRGIIYEGKEYNLNENSPGFKLIYKIQEEAHRFAISYHRSLRDKRLYRSELDNIKGVGPKRKQELYKHFKTIDRIKSASLEELKEVKSINKKVAEDIYNYFNKD